jgi:nucleotidyltransferase AbiEii toxin of type IV toxin-antitoxin system
MAQRAGLPASQRRALGRLSGLPIATELYLAGGVAIAIHLGHRTSRDLDLFGRSADLDLDRVHEALRGASMRVELIARSDATLHMRFEGADLDVVRYPYRLLAKSRRHESGIQVASLRDLTAMKLAEIAKRGIRRDFWDLHAILTGGARITLRRALEDYQVKFGVAEADVYHVLRALNWFEDAERDEVLPRGLTERHWRAIRLFFEEAARREIDRRARLARSK